MSYVLMELTKVTDRVDALENDSNDDNDEAKSVGAVNIEFTGEFLMASGTVQGFKVFTY